MSDPTMTLVASAVEAALRTLADEPTSDAAWAAARTALVHHSISATADPELSAAIERRDAAALADIHAQWTSGKRVMLEHDREVLKRAMKAYRKSLKVTLLDAESSVGGGPMSSGRRSTIRGIVPPNRYPREVWDALVRQKRLAALGRGVYELGEVP